MRMQGQAAVAATVQPWTAGDSKQVQAIWIAGPEDIVVDHEAGVAYVSSQVRIMGADTSTQQGAIQALDLKVNEPQPLNLTTHLPATLRRPRGAFHPHGISFWSGEDGTRRLFVINHITDDHTTIELFDVRPDRLVHLGTVSDDTLLTSPNDLVGFGPDSFYLTNDHGYRAQILKTLEDVLHLRLGNVVCWTGALQERGGTGNRVAAGLSFPNGIATHPIGNPTRVFVASVWGKKLLDYACDPAQPGAPLSLQREIPLPAAPDNLEWDEEGHLWAGCHPDLAALLSHALGHRRYAPSLVLRISDILTDEPRIEEVFRDDGTLLSACSVAALYHREGRKRLLIGSFSDDHLLICDL